MTDNDIRNAIYGCVNSTVKCNECPFIDEVCEGEVCSDVVLKYAVDLISRQQLEIAVLKNELPDRKYGCCVSVKNGLIYTHTIDDYDRLIGDICSDGIKRLVEMLHDRVSGIGVHSAIDCVAKEMGVDV